jgi:hypothetical protein
MNQGADVIRIDGVIHPQQTDVALQLPLVCRALLVAEVENLHVAPCKLVTELIRLRSKLLVNAPVPADIRMPPEQPRMRDQVRPFAREFRRADGVHQPGPRLVVKRGQQRLQSVDVLGREAVVGVEPKNPFARRLAQTLVARGREIIGPGKLQHVGRESSSNLPRVVVRARIDNHDLVEQIGDRLQAIRQLTFFIADDHAQRNGRLRAATHVAPQNHERVGPSDEMSRGCLGYGNLRAGVPNAEAASRPALQTREYSSKTRLLRAGSRG